MFANSLVRLGLVAAAFGVSATPSLAAGSSAVPVITITNPKREATLTASPVLLSGTTRSRVAVENVLYNVNHTGAWSGVYSSDGFSNWQAQVSLAAGTNVISVSAVNTNGQASATNEVTVFLIKTSVLTIDKTGAGVVSPNDNGKALDVGRDYTLHALAAAGFRFTNWVVRNGANSSNSTSARLTFMMESNLVIDANFADIQKPALSLTPPTTIRTSNTVVSFSGKARDNAGVAAVEFQVNGGAVNFAASNDGFTNWTGTFIVPAGNYTVDVWAVDDSGNRSASKTVRVIDNSPGLAPQALDGLTLAASAFTNYFGEGTYGLISNKFFAAGVYTYALSNANAALVSATAMVPLGAAPAEAVTLTFASITNGIYTDAFGDSGPFTISLAPSTAPANLAQATILGNDLNGYLFTDNLSDGSAVRTDTQDLTGAGTYTYAVLAPQIGLLAQDLFVEALSHTNYALLVFSTNAAGTNLYFTQESQAGLSNDDNGVFTLSIPSNTAAGTVPGSIAGLTADVTEVVSNKVHLSYAAGFGAATFGVFENKTAGLSGLGTYTFTRTGAGTASLAYDYLVPSTATNDSASLALTFVRTNMAMFTNGSTRGTMTFRRAATLAPVSIGDAKLRLSLPGAVSWQGFSIASQAVTSLATNIPPQGQPYLTYTCGQFSPQSVLLLELATFPLLTTNGTYVAGTNSLELWFTAASAGDVISGTNIGKFTLEK